MTTQRSSPIPASDPQAIRELNDAVTDMLLCCSLSDPAPYDKARDRYFEAKEKLSTILSALGSPASPQSERRLKAKAEYLRGLVRESRPGGCQILSVAECGCPLCAIDELLKAALGSSASPSPASEGREAETWKQAADLLDRYAGQAPLSMTGTTLRTIATAFRDRAAFAASKADTR